MSTAALPMLSETGWIEYPSDFCPDDQVQNYCLCAICHNPFLLDISGSPYCGREICVAVRMHMQKQVEAQAEQARRAVA